MPTKTIVAADALELTRCFLSDWNISEMKGLEQQKTIQRLGALTLIFLEEGMVLQERIELSTSPLPRECSTTELLQHSKTFLSPEIVSRCGRFFAYRI